MSKLILVVDDEPDQRELMRDILELFGYEVETASDGANALSYLSTGPAPKLIFLDITMPVMSGREFLATIHSGKYKHLEKIPVVVISAVVDFARLRTDYKCVAFLKKPAQIEAILRLAEEFV